MICAQEATGVLAYAESGVYETGSCEPAELARAVLSLVDRGWVTVHRIEPWAARRRQRSPRASPGAAWRGWPRAKGGVSAGTYGPGHG